MPAQRSYEHFEVGQQLYAVLEAIEKPEALWAKPATALRGLPDGRGRGGCLPAGRGRRPRHTTAEFRRVESATRPRRRGRGRGLRGPRAAAAGL